MIVQGVSRPYIKEQVPTGDNDFGSGRGRGGRGRGRGGDRGGRGGGRGGRGGGEGINYESQFLYSSFRGFSEGFCGGAIRLLNFQYGVNNLKLIIKVDSEAEAVVAEEAASGTGAAARPYPLLRHADLLLRAGPAEDWPPEAGNWSGRPSAAAAAAGGTGETATAVVPRETTGGHLPRRTGRGIATGETETREGHVQLVTKCKLTRNLKEQSFLCNSFLVPLPRTIKNVFSVLS